MENEQLIQSTKDVFSSADKRDWAKVQRVMAKQVLVDYSSMTSTSANYEVTGSFLPGFGRTHHHLSEF